VAPLPGEFDLIARYFAPLARNTPGALGLQDDAVTFTPPPGCELVLTTDALTADLHFLRSDPPDLIARKMLRVNLSDLAGKGAKPLGYLMTTAFDRSVDEAWIKTFAEGLAQDQEAFGLTLLGGDTTSTPGPLALTATLIGAVPAGRALRRTGARPGDRILVTGTIGDGYFGLGALRGEFSQLPAEHRRFLTGRYQLPEPRVALGQAMAERGLGQAGMDVSDGLAADLGHLCAASGCGARVALPQVPVSPALAELLADDPDQLLSAVTRGDDYELIFAVAPDQLPEVFAAAAATNTLITEIGVFTAAKDVIFTDSDGQPVTLPKAGFTHF
jgi:thiamine-monophosphate kinase